MNSVHYINYPNKPPSLPLKKLVDDLELKYKEYCTQFQELPMKENISRLNDKIKLFVKDLENTWASMIFEFKETFNQLIPQLKEAVLFESKLFLQEKELENSRIEINVDREMFENEKKKYEDMYHLPSEILELNVGGNYFCTLRSTLTKVVPDSMLSSMYSGRWPITCDINGHFFIDRDPKLFKLVLNGLRNNGYWIEPSEPDEKNGLLVELDYFCFKMLIDQNDLLENNRIYIMGGWPSSGNHRQVEYLDIKHNSWEPACDLSIKRSYCSAVSTHEIHDRIYIIGGSELKIVEYLDVKENRWHSVASLSTPRWASAAVYLKRKIYVMGGDDKGTCHKSVECYDVQNDFWTMKKPMHIARSALAASILKDEIYAMGGCYIFHNKPLNSVEKYDPISNNWTYIAPLLTAREFLAAVTLNGRIYAIGGHDCDTQLQSVECYNPFNNSWSYVQSMKNARYSFAAVNANNKIYVFGGMNNNDLLKIVEEFDPESEKWQYISNMLNGRADFAAVGI